MESATHYLDLAARLALRAAGDVEPNPCVGAVIVKDGRVIGVGHHRKYGHLHAEREALADCRRRAHDPRGATAYVTLEPCCHFGKQPPCTDALIEAGVAQVVAARPDPNPVSGGGAAVLAIAGIPCEFTDASPLATHVSDPFVKRITTGQPWVIAKWAQTIDGRVATRTGDSKWISGPLMRRRVHRLRARVDAILTGAGTIRADDPMLTARDVPRVRRVARRVIVTTSWQIPPDARVVTTARDVPTAIAGPAFARREQANPLTDAGVRLLATSAPAGGVHGVNLKVLLRGLADMHGVTNVLVEAGPTLLGALFKEGLVDEAIVHVAPMLMGDEEARTAAAIGAPEKVADLTRLRLWRAKRIGDEMELVYRRGDAAPTPDATASRTQGPAAPSP